MENKVPFVDLKSQYISIKDSIDTAIHNVIMETEFIKGKYVKEFESEFARQYGVKHCIGVANGTDAIYIVLKMLGIGPGDEVITTAHSWISTSETISQAGAKPVFVDVDEFYTINAEQLEAKITPRTKAIIPVHIFGQPAEIDKVKDICNKHGLFLIEDCAQAHFAEYNGQKVGTFGIAATFSFYPGKNLGAYGDAGAIITNDDELADKCRMYANHGALIKHQHHIEGINSRLDGLQAAILTVKMKYIHEWNRCRLENSLKLSEMLNPIPGIQIPKIRPNAKHVFHVYCIQTERREALQKHLSVNGIETAIHYPTALPNLPAYSYLGLSSAQFPVATKNQDRILSLPMFPELNSEQMCYITEIIKTFQISGQG